MCTATNPRKLCKKREWCGQNCWFQIWLWPKSHYPVPRPKVLSHAVSVNYARDNLFLLCARCLMSIGTIHFHFHSSHPLWSVQNVNTLASFIHRKHETSECFMSITVTFNFYFICVNHEFCNIYFYQDYIPVLLQIFSNICQEFREWFESFYTYIYLRGRGWLRRKRQGKRTSIL